MENKENTAEKRPFSRRVLWFLTSLIAASLLSLAVEIGLHGMWLLGIPRAEDITLVEVTDARYGETRSFVDPEDIRLAYNCAGLLRYGFGKPQEEDMVVAMAYHTKSGKIVRIGAGETTVYYNGSYHPLKQDDLFLNITEGLFFFDRASQASLAEKVSDVLGVDCTQGEVEASMDTREYGEGEVFIMLAFPEGTTPGGLEENIAWQPLPLTEELTALAYGIETENGVMGPYLMDAKLPRVEHGFYFFLDRQDEKQQARGGFLNRGSLNATLAIFDTDKSVLYYVTLDT